MTKKWKALSALAVVVFVFAIIAYRNRRSPNKTCGVGSTAWLCTIQPSPCVKATYVEVCSTNLEESIVAANEKLTEQFALRVPPEMIIGTTCKETNGAVAHQVCVSNPADGGPICGRWGRHYEILGEDGGVLWDADGGAL